MVLVAADCFAAERLLRDGYRVLGEYGEVGYRSTVAAQLSEALACLERYEEAIEMANVAIELGGGGDIITQIKARSAKGVSLVAIGEVEAGVQLADQAVRSANSTDYAGVIAEAETASVNSLQDLPTPGRLIAG